MQTLLTHLLKIQAEVESAKRTRRDYLLIIGTVVSTFLYRATATARGTSRLRNLRNGLTIANSIELFLHSTTLTPLEESEIRELLAKTHARINDLTQAHGHPEHCSSHEPSLS